MSLISQSINNLYNGISQQPAPQRHPSQCEVMDNAYPTLASGLAKRPPTLHHVKLSATPVGNVFVHTINRSEAERYVVILAHQSIKVYDVATGGEKTVSTPDGVSYLTSTDARNDFAVVTVADYTFIVNKTVTVTMNTGATSPAPLAGTKQKFSDLPAPTGTGNVWKIEGDPTNFFDNYYVKDSAASTWQETIAPSTLYNIAQYLMPYLLVRNGDGTFTFTHATYADRVVGDVTSNPNPSFIGRKISDVFFYRNRLGFISDENIILSRSGDYFNFFAETVTAVLDSDPVDIGVTTTQVAILRHAVPFNKVLLAFSNQAQFQLTSGDVLTPKTAKADPVTSFESDAGCKPVGSGQELFFSVNKAGSTGIREYYVESDTISNDAADITAHVPTYVPANVYKLAISTNEDVLLALSSLAPQSIYLYKFYWGKDEKVQSAWGQFTFPATDTVLNADFIGTKLYIVIQRSDGVYLEYMDVQPDKQDDVGFLVHLDRRVVLTGSYSSGTGLTTWTLPYSDSGAFQVVLGAGFTGKAGAALITTKASNTTITAVGDYSAASCYVGRTYAMTYQFSELYARDQDGVALTGAVLKLKRLQISYNKTGYFRVAVTPKARDTYSYIFTGKVLGDSSLVIGAPALLSGTKSIPIMAGNLGTTITLYNESHLPCFFQSAEWLGELTLKAKRQ